MHILGVTFTIATIGLCGLRCGILTVKPLLPTTSQIYPSRTCRSHFLGPIGDLVLLLHLSSQFLSSYHTG